MGESSKTDKYWTGTNTLGKFSSFIVFSQRKGSVYTILNGKNSKKLFLAHSTREQSKGQQQLIGIEGGNWRREKARERNATSACKLSSGHLLVRETCTSDVDVNGITKNKITSEPRCVLQLIARGEGVCTLSPVTLSAC